MSTGYTLFNKSKRQRAWKESMVYRVVYVLFCLDLISFVVVFNLHQSSQIHLATNITGILLTVLMSIAAWILHTK